MTIKVPVMDVFLTVLLVHFKNSVNPGPVILLKVSIVKTVKQWFCTVLYLISRKALLVLSRRSLVDHYGTLAVHLLTH